MWFKRNIIVGTKEELLDYFKDIKPFEEIANKETFLKFSETKIFKCHLSDQATIEQQIDGLITNKIYMSKIWYNEISLLGENETVLCRSIKLQRIEILLKPHHKFKLM